MIRGKTKEEYIKWLDESSNRELLNSMLVAEPVDATVLEKCLTDVDEYFKSEKICYYQTIKTL